MISLYRPGSGWLHRAPAALKLAGLALVAIGVMAVASSIPAALLVLAGACAVHLTAGLGVAGLVREVWRLRWIIVLMTLSLVVFTSLPIAIVNTSRVLSLLLVASAVTVSTRTGDLLNVLERVLSPARRLGIDPRRVSLVLLLTLVTVPVVAELARQVREAQRARGIPPGLGFVMPLLVLVLRHADDVGDALSARGVV